MMKRTFCLLSCFVFMIALFTGCASTSASENTEKSDGNEVTVPETEELEPVVRFVDWQYKGFGKELPVWADAVFDNQMAEIKKLIPELADSKVVLICVAAETLDQAESFMNTQAEQTFDVLDDVYSLWARTWVRVDENYVKNEGCTYCALGIFALKETGL